MKRIDIPGVGLVDFPDSMTDAEISSAIETDILKTAAQPEPPKSKGLFSKIGDTFNSAVESLNEFDRKQIAAQEKKQSVINADLQKGNAGFSYDNIGNTLPSINADKQTAKRLQQFKSDTDAGFTPEDAAQNAYVDQSIAADFANNQFKADAQAASKSLQESATELKDKPQRSLGDVYGDLANTALKVAPAALKQGIELADFLSLGSVDLGVIKYLNQGLEGMDQTFGSESLQREKEDFADVMQSGDFTSGVRFLLRNPMYLADQGITSMGSALIPAGTTAAILKVATAIKPSLTVKAAQALTSGSVAATVALQNAASTFNSEELKDLPLSKRYEAAAMTAILTLGANKVFGGGLDKAIADKLGNTGARQGFALALKEGGQEFGESAGQSFSIDAVAPEKMTFEKGLNQALTEGALGTVGGGVFAGVESLTSNPRLTISQGDNAADEATVAALQAQYDAETAKQEADAALAAIPEATSVDDAIKLASETIKAPIESGTGLLGQINQYAAEAIPAADILGSDNVSNLQNDVSTELANSTIASADNNAQGSVGNLSDQPAGRDDAGRADNTAETLAQSSGADISTGNADAGNDAVAKQPEPFMRNESQEQSLSNAQEAMIGDMQNVAPSQPKYGVIDTNTDNEFNYVNGNVGMTSNGSFTKDKSRWAIFSREEAERMQAANIKPYGASKQGVFTGTVLGDRIKPAKVAPVQVPVKKSAKEYLAEVNAIRKNSKSVNRLADADVGTLNKYTERVFELSKGREKEIQDYFSNPKEDANDDIKQINSAIDEILRSDKLDADTRLKLKQLQYPSATDETIAKAEPPKPKTNAKPKAAKAPKTKSLLAVLRDLGGIANSEKLDITGEQRGFAPGGYNQIFKKASTRSLKGLIESGELDEYLPYNMRLETNGANDDAFDSTEAYDYLADKIRNGDQVLPYEAQQEFEAAAYEARQNENQDDNPFGDDDNPFDTIDANLTDEDVERIFNGTANDAARESDQVSNEANTENAIGDTGSNQGQTQGQETNAGQQAQVAGDFTLSGQTNEDINAGIAAQEAEARAQQEQAKSDEAARIEAERKSRQEIAADSFDLTPTGKTAKETQANDAKQIDNQFAGQGDLLAAPQVEAQANQPTPELNTANSQQAIDAIKQDDTIPTADKIKLAADLRNGNVTAEDVKAIVGDTTQEDTQDQLAATNIITDFGEKLEGAKKDLWQTYKKSMSDELPSDLTQITLAKHYPEPDYDNLIASGLEVKAIAAIKAMRDEIPAKPRMPSKLRRWASELSTLREFANGIIDGKYSIEEILQMMRERQPLQRFVERIELYADLGFPAMKSAKGYNITSGWTSFDRNNNPEPGKKTAIEYPNGKREYFNDRETALAALRQKLEIAPESTEKKTKLDVYKVTTTGEIVIGKKVASNKYIDLKGGFKTPKEAFQYYADNEAQLLELLEQRKNFKPERRSTNNPRLGTDYRLGEDVTPEKFAAEFGFRGVQFGNYVEQSRRNRDLNNAYDALLDLASIINVPPRAISLNGSLGLAFGARGSGGKNAAAAHYERDQVVINLTKVNGFGSLGHEWFHALDNYFSKARGDNEYLTQKPTQKRIYQAGAGFSTDKSIRQEVLTAFKNLMDGIKNSDYYTRSVQRDNTRTKDYWGTAEELAARAFEAYLIAKSKEAGKENDYLANIEDEDVYEIANQAAKDFGAFEDPYPYPTRSEQEAINPLFDALFGTLKTKESDNGNVMFFSRNTQSRTPFIAQQDEGYITTLNKVIALFKSGNRAKQQEAGKTPVPISRTPVVLRQVIDDDGSKPFKRSDFVVGQGSTLYLKADNIHGKSIHTGRISKEVLNNLPKLLADPIAIFKSSSSSEDSKSFKVLLDANDENGDPVILAIKPNVPMQQLNNAPVNFQATIFPAKWDKVREWNENGLLRYYNEKSPRASRPANNPLGTVSESSKNTREGFEASQTSVVPSNPGEAAIEVDARESFDANIGVSTSNVKVITKSDIENMPEVAFSRSDSPIFYSQLSRAIAESKQDTMPAKQWAAWLNANAGKLGVKKDELQWTGITDWLDLQQGKVSKADIQAYLDANGVQIDEVINGGDTGLNMNSRYAAIPEVMSIVRQNQGSMDDALIVALENDYDAYQAIESKYPEILENEDWAQEIVNDLTGGNSNEAATRYDKYTVPGGENYKELLLTLPVKTDRNSSAWMEEAKKRYYEKDIPTLSEGQKQIIDRAASGMNYKSSHWDETNILAHVRFDERTDADGNRVLFINEIQSDFGQDYKKAKDAISKAVDDDFNGIVERMKAAGVLEVNCD